MNRIALSVLLVPVPVACGSDAESREDLESQAVIPAAAARPAAASQPAWEPPAKPVRAIPAGALLTAGTPARGLVTEAHSSTGSDDVSLLAVHVASVEAGGSQKAVEGVVQSAAIEGDTRTRETAEPGPPPRSRSGRPPGRSSDRSWAAVRDPP